MKDPGFKHKPESKHIDLSKIICQEEEEDIRPHEKETLRDTEASTHILLTGVLPSKAMTSWNPFHPV